MTLCHNPQGGESVLASFVSISACKTTIITLTHPYTLTLSHSKYFSPNVSAAALLISSIVYMLIQFLFKLSY